jgi:hypothetical protein
MSSTLAKMKAELVELEIQKKKLTAEIEKNGKQFRLGLWILVAGVILIPVYGIGIAVALIGMVISIINNEKRAKEQDTLAEILEKISNLENSMA